MTLSLLRRSLVARCIAIIFCSTTVAAAAALPGLYFILKHGMEEQRQRHLDSVRHLVERLFDGNRKIIRNYAVLFSGDRQVKDNLYYYAELAGERSHPLAAIQHLVNAFDVRFIELGDRKGRLVANTATPELHDLDRSGDGFVRAALKGKISVGIEARAGEFLLKAVAPVYHDENQLIGTITTGVPIDQNFVQELKGVISAEIIVVDGREKVMASTLTAGGFNPHKGGGKSIDIDGNRYQAIRLPLEDGKGQALGSVVLLAADHVPALFSRAMAAHILVLVVVAALSIAATSVVFRRLLEPINRLREGAACIGSGDFAQRIPVDSEDEIGGLAAVFNRMAENLQEMRTVEKRLQHAERLALIGEFTAGVAHELNNPIANIIGLAKMAQKEALPVGPLREDLEILVREAGRCGSIVRDLLVYCRSSRPSLERVDMHRLVEENMAAVLLSGDTAGRITVVHPPMPPGADSRVRVDPVQISQVLRNLLLNAVQAIETEGTVTVAEDFSGDPVRIVVTDTGCGMTTEVRDKAFYPFFTTKKSGAGTGLGLAVCYAIMQGHGGAIELRSSPGSGSTFTVTLPRGDRHGEV